MKLKHMIFIGFLIVGALYVFHTYTMHGGVSGFRSGLGLNH